MDEQINCQKIKEEIKLVSIKELPFVMEIINDAKKLLGRDSLQWQQGYPNEITMLKIFIICVKDYRQKKIF